MDYMDLLFILIGSAVVMIYGVKLLFFVTMLYPKLFFPLPKSFLRSMGEWAVVTGGSEGIGRAYAFELASQGMNVVILSRTKEKLDQAAKEIVDKTGQKVKVIIADFTRDNVLGEIKEKLKDLEIGVLVNNVGIIPTIIPGKYLEVTDLEQTITKVITCNVKTMVKMCRIILPGMEKRGKGVIVNVSSGMTSVSTPMYSLYTGSKVFVERFSMSLQAEYRDKGIIIQTVAPFGVCTSMTDYYKDVVTLLPEEFVKSSLQYLKAGDKTHGSISHLVMGWLLQALPSQILQSEFVQQRFKEIVKRRFEP